MNEDRPDWDQRSPVQWAEHEDLSTIVNQFVETGMNTDGVVKAALLNAGWQPLMRSNPGSTVRRLRTNFSVK